MKLLALLCLLAAPLVAHVEATYQNTPALQVEFIQKTEVALLDKTVTRPGRIFYQKGGKIRIEYAGEIMTHYISDGATLWIVHPGEQELQTYPLKDSGLPEEALHFLTELGQLRNYFVVQTAGEKKLVLKPKQKSSYRSLTCQFSDNHYLQALTIHSHSGNTSHYQFFNLKVKKALPAKLFRP